MQTDIEMNHADTRRRVVIDTKFTRILTASNYRAEVLRSGYLYQMYAYLRTQEQPSDPPSLAAEGILLHPQVGGAVNETMVVHGHSVAVRTIDLTTSARRFEEQLTRLAVSQRQ